MCWVWGVVAFLCVTLLMPDCGYSLPLRDRPDNNSWLITAQISGANEELDFFDLQQVISDVEEAAEYYAASVTGEREIAEDLFLRGLIAFERLDVGLADIEYLTAEVSARKWRELGSSGYFLSVGVKGHLAEDVKLDSARALNRLSSIAGSQIGITETASHLVFEGSDFTLFIDKRNETPHLMLEGMGDLTAFAGVGVEGRLSGKFLVGLNVELGRTTIFGSVSSNFDNWTDIDPLAGTVELDRTETYASGQLFAQYQLFQRVATRIAYTKRRLSRDDVESRYNGNDILEVDVNCQMTDKLILNVGGTYLHSHFNGEVPFFYNAYTASTFDNAYGYVRAGVSYLF